LPSLPLGGVKPYSGNKKKKRKDEETNTGGSRCIISFLYCILLSRIYGVTIPAVVEDRKSPLRYIQ